MHGAGLSELEEGRMATNRSQSAWALISPLLSLTLCFALIGAQPAAAQAPAASGDAAQAPSPEELERLVGPIALYPDDLVAIILPASTNPLQIVQADRFLDKRKKDPNTPIDDRWDDSVKSLVNYPEVIKQMSGDLDWTADLGEAVVADQGAVLDAVQAFRRKAQAAKNLKSDDKQTIVVEKEIIKIVPADPQVIYVPQYNPTTVVVYSSFPVYGYWPSPYPVYYYPYPPGAAFATGLIWGAAIGSAWRGGYYGTNWGGGNNSNNNITINRGNTNINTGNINRGNVNRPSQQPAGGGTAWKPDKKPGQVSTGAGRPTTTSATRPGGGTGGAGGARPSTQPAGGATGGAGARPSTQPAGGGQGAAARNQSGATSASGAATRTGASGGGGGGRDAFGGYGSGNAARADSSRGAASRESMSGGGARQMQGGGGARAGGGGGGGGGGGRGGGGGGRGR
jgi:hypothetical protein